MSLTTELKKTPLFDCHAGCQARLVDFGGWHMPVQYSSILDEHNAVRTGVGLFDVSHMGEIDVRGPEAALLVDHVATNHAAKLKIGQAHYSALLYDHGGFVDDILVHKVAGDHFFLCVNASNQEKDFAHIAAHNRFNAEVLFTSERYAQLAIQGPKALATLQKLTPVDLRSIKYYWFADGLVAGEEARIAHTGYTGEDGFEIYLSPLHAARIWQDVLAAGAEFGIRPCGLGARNTLRLEAKMALYGHELTASTSPLEADLAWIVKMDKGDFIGRSALEKASQTSLTRKLAGFVMRDRGIARDGYEIWIANRPAGWVTSGGPSPTLNQNIGLGYLPLDQTAPGTPITIQIRHQPVAAEVVATPFYKRAK